MKVSLRATLLLFASSLVILTVSGEQVFAQWTASSGDAPGGRLTSRPDLINECDFCVASQGISPLEMGRTGVRYDVRYLQVSNKYVDGSKVTNDENEIESHLTNQFTFLYQILPRLSGSLIVPFADRRGSIEGDLPSSVVNAGLGDVSVLLRYNVLSDHKFADTRLISLNAGVKLPTGATDKRDNTGELADAHLQLGTGSTDLLLGTSLLLGFDRFAIAANLTGILSGKGANGHQFGNNLNYEITGRYRIYPSEVDYTTLFATLGLTGEWRGHEIEDGEIDPNSGGNTTYLAPGLQLFLSPSVSVEASYQYPIVHALNGEQLGESYRIMGGLMYMF